MCELLCLISICRLPAVHPSELVSCELNGDCDANAKEAPLQNCSKKGAVEPRGYD